MNKVFLKLFIISIMIFGAAQCVLALDLVQSYNGYGGGVYSFGYSSQQQAWFQFVPNGSYCISQIGVEIQKVNSPTNDIQASIWDMASGIPNTLLQFSDSVINGANVVTTPNYDYYNWTFNPCYNVTINTNYTIVLNTSSVSLTNYYNPSGDTTGNLTSGNSDPKDTFAIKTSVYNPPLRFYTGEVTPPAPDNTTTCQDLTIANSVFILNNSVSVSGTCYEFKENNITLDCNGYNIVGTNPGSTFAGARSVMNYTTIKNCNISGFYNTISIWNQTDAVNIQRHNINIQNNNLSCYISGGTALEFRFADDSRIEYNYIYSDTADAIFIVGETNNLTIFNNTIIGDEFGISFYGLPTINYVHTNTNISNNYIESMTSATASNTIGYVGIFDKSTNVNTTIQYNTLNSSKGTKYILRFNSGSSGTVVLNNLFYGNNWITNSEINAQFNDSATGNRYIYSNGSEAYQYYNWTDTNNDSYADSGSDLPISASLVGSTWTGSGVDWHPYTTNQINITPPAPTPPVIPPVYKDKTFDNKTTTNLTAVSDIANVTNFTIASSTSAVQWLNNVNLTGITTITDAILTTSSYISINTALAPSLDTPADVALTINDCNNFNLYYASGFYTIGSDIIRNGVVVATAADIGGDCTVPSICTNIQCANGTLTFTAQHFDGFGVGTQSVIDQPTIAGITNTKNLVYAGLALIAVMILVAIAWGLISLFNNGPVDFMTITVAAIGGGIVIMLAYIIIYYVALGMGA